MTDQVQLYIVFSPSEKELYHRISRLEKEHGEAFPLSSYRDDYLRYLYHAGKGYCSLKELEIISCFFQSYTVTRLFDKYGVKKILPHLSAGCQFPDELFDTDDYQGVVDKIYDIFSRRQLFSFVRVKRFFKGRKIPCTIYYWFLNPRSGFYQGRIFDYTEEPWTQGKLYMASEDKLGINFWRDKFEQGCSFYLCGKPHVDHILKLCEEDDESLALDIDEEYPDNSFPAYRLSLKVLFSLKGDVIMKKWDIDIWKKFIDYHQVSLETISCLYLLENFLFKNNLGFLSIFSHDQILAYRDLLPDTIYGVPREKYHLFGEMSSSQLYRDYPVDQISVEDAKMITDGQLYRYYYSDYCSSALVKNYLIDLCLAGKIDPPSTLAPEIYQKHPEYRFDYSFCEHIIPFDAWESTPSISHRYSYHFRFDRNRFITTPKQAKELPARMLRRCLHESSFNCDMAEFLMGFTDQELWDYRLA